MSDNRGVIKPSGAYTLQSTTENTKRTDTLNNLDEILGNSAKEKNPNPNVASFVNHLCKNLQKWTTYQWLAEINKGARVKEN